MTTLALRNGRDDLYWEIHPEKFVFPPAYSLRTHPCFADVYFDGSDKISDNSLHAVLGLNYYPKVWAELKPVLDMAFVNLGISYHYFTKAEYRSGFRMIYEEVPEYIDSHTIVVMNFDTDLFTKKAGIQVLYLLFVFIRSFSYRKAYLYGLEGCRNFDYMMDEINTKHGEETLSEYGYVTFDTILELDNYERMNKLFTDTFHCQTTAFELIQGAL